MAKQLDPDWVVLEAQQPAALSDFTLQAIANVITNYLQHLAMKHLELPSEESILTAITTDLVEYLSGISRESTKIGWISLCFRGNTNDSKAKVFAEILSDFVSARDLKYITECTSKNGKVIVNKAGELYIPKRHYCNALLEYSHIMPKYSTITDILAASDKLIGETESCWIVNAAWWLDIHTNRTSAEERMLKIIG
jgi:hypothetical protein